jgi:hypothetical protein
MKNRILTLSLLMIVFAIGTQCSLAQYGVNWPTQPATPMATGVEPGTQTLKVSGVNDFLYAYEINVVEIETPIPVPSLSAGALVGCTDAQVAALQAHIQAANSAYQKLFPDSATPPKTLAQTQDGWKTTVKPLYDNLPQDFKAAQIAVDAMPVGTPKSPCQSVIDSANESYKLLQNADAKLKGNHTIEASFVAKACKSEILTINEKYRGVPTGQSITVRLDARCDEFTVSGGVLLTEIQNRTYLSSPSPTQAGQFLSVGGTGKFHPTIILLTNFNFPFEPFGHSVSSNLGDARLGVSTGPVIQVGSTSTSAFGWFVGGSLSFFHRLYLTPGVHIGQFADFPLGFAPGQQIPANFGQLTPVPRTTARFALSITVQGWDLSKMLKGGSDQPQPAHK